MAEKKEVKRDESGKRMSPEESRAQDEAQGKPESGQILLTNDSGEVKRLDPEEWENEERQAELMKQGWKELGGEE